MHRMPVLTALAAALVPFLIVDSLRAQPAPRRFGTITCETTIDEIPRHPLGLTNQIGTIQFACTNDGRVPPGETSEFRTHVVVDLMVSLNAGIGNRIDFGEGADVTDAVLAFGGDEDAASVDSGVGSSVDPRFPRPQYGRMVMSNGTMTQTGKRLGLGPIQGNGMGTILFFDDVMFPVPFARNGTYPRCMNFRADDPDGCLPSTIEAVIKNLRLSPQDTTPQDLLGAYQPTFMSSSDRLRFQPDSLELDQVCRPRPAAVPGPCSGPDPATGARSCGTFHFFDLSDQANFELCVKVLDGTQINDRFWVFAAATTDVEYTLRVVDTESSLRHITNPNPDGTGGEFDPRTDFPLTDAELFGLEEDDEDGGITDKDMRFGFEILAETTARLKRATFTFAPAPTSTIDMLSAKAPPQYLDIRGTPLADVAELIGDCPAVNLATGDPACGPSIRSVTDISFIEGDLVPNGFFSVFVAGAPAETFFADSLPLGQDGPIRIKITQGTTTVEALNVFSDGSQYNGIIPKDAPLGLVEIRLCVGDQESAPFPAVIVGKKPRLFTLDGFGSGMGVFQKFDDERVPTVPLFDDGFESGDITAWGTGLGTSSKRSDRDVSPVENFADSSDVEVLLGGVPAKRIFYAGPNPEFPALDQWNILPDEENMPHGCFIPLDIVVNDCPPSNSVGIPVSPDGGACFDPVNPFLEDSGMWPRNILDVQLLRAQVTIPTADGKQTQLRVEQARAEAGQYNFTNFNVGVHYPSLGTCTAFNGPGRDQDDLLRRPPPIALRTGEFRMTRLSLSDTVTFDTPDPGVDMWSQQLFDPEADPFFVFNDTYTLRHTGGDDVPAFTTEFRIGIRLGFGDPTPQSELNGIAAGVPSNSQGWTNQSSFGRKTVIGQDLTLEWDGSGIDPAKTAITITGVSLGENQVGGFICTVDPTLGIFTVPGRLTANMPRTRNPESNVPLGGLAVGTIGTKEGRIVIDPLEQAGMRAYIDFQQRDVLNTVWDTCAFAACP